MRSATPCGGNEPKMEKVATQQDMVTSAHGVQVLNEKHVPHINKIKTSGYCGEMYSQQRLESQEVFETSLIVNAISRLLCYAF